jgi:alkylhydroperoxidase/carboxymuconolactone decarboxylase family protein YurZ
MQDPMAAEARDLLRRLAAGDERSLRNVLAPTPEFSAEAAPLAAVLDRRTRVLVRLAALLAVGAPPASLRWAVELAASAGVDEESVVAVLVAAASAAGSAQVVASAPDLALALGFDVQPAGY